MDFRIDDYGELDNENIEIINNNEYRVQLAKSRVKSINKDWYYDNIGANIEEMFGEFFTQTTETIFKEKLLNSLIFDEVFNEDDVFIKTSQNHKTMSVKADIYIKNINDNSTYAIIPIKLDLFNGVLISE